MKDQNVNPPEDLEQIVAELVGCEYDIDQRQQEIKKIEARKVLLQDKIRSALGTYKKDVQVGALKVSWNPPNSTFRAAEFIAAYPPEQNQHMYKQVPNSDAIPPALYSQFKKPGTGAGTVKVS